MKNILGFFGIVVLASFVMGSCVSTRYTLQDGAAAMTRRDYDEAIRIYTAVIQSNPRDAEGYFQRGAAFRHNGDFQSAITDYETGLQINPNRAFVRERLEEARQGLANMPTQTTQQLVQSQQQLGQAAPILQASPFWTGDGGRGKSIAILAPRATGLADSQSHLPLVVQGEFVSNFSSFSAMRILDRSELNEQYAELLSGHYDDDSEELHDLGRLPPTDYLMSGSIIRTTTGYALQMRITKNADKSVVAMHSETSSFAELDNLTAIRRASLDLLDKMGLRPTGRTRTELARAVPENHINAQTALARGFAAQRQGLEITALSFFQQAIDLDPFLTEAESHLNVASASISRGAGTDPRNDIQWRNQWITRLREAEAFPAYFRSISPPFYLVYSNNFEQGAIDYVRETVSLSIDLYSLPEPLWFETVNRLNRTVRNGLQATGRADAWNLNWPAQTLSAPSPFAGRNTSYTVIVELIDASGRNWGRQTINFPFDWFSPIGGIETGLIAPRIQFTATKLTFSGIDVNNIDNLNIRIVSINGISAENVTAQLGIRVLPENEFNNIQSIRDNGLRTDNLRLFNIVFTNQNSNLLTAYNGGTSAAIPYGATLLNGDSGFQDRGLVSVTLPSSLTQIAGGGGGGHSMRSGTFNTNQLTSIIIPDSVISIGPGAFQNNPLSRVTIGEGVSLAGPHPTWYPSNSFPELNNPLDSVYNNNGRRAGTYITVRGQWSSNWVFSGQ